MFQWMEILAPGLVAQAVLALCIVAAVGLAIGNLGFRGIRLGAAGVLFAEIGLEQVYTNVALSRLRSPVRWDLFWPARDAL